MPVAWLTSARLSEFQLSPGVAGRIADGGLQVAVHQIQERDTSSAATRAPASADHRSAGRAARGRCCAPTYSPATTTGIAETNRMPLASIAAS